MVHLREIASAIVVSHGNAAEGESESRRKLGAWNAEYPFNRESVTTLQGSVRARLGPESARAGDAKPQTTMVRAAIISKFEIDLICIGDLLVDPSGI